mgnify:CR=1 FL=1
MGKSKLTKTRCEFICANLRKGNYLTTCARACGVSVSTLNNWKKRGRKGEEPYKTFLEKVDEAEAEGELRSMGIIDDVASTGNWLASAWKLERKYPQRFGKKERMEIGSDEDFKIEIQSKKSPYKMASDERKLLDSDE